MAGKHTWKQACLNLLAMTAMLTVSAAQAVHTLTFKVGTVIGEKGLCSEMGDAHRGYLLFANKLATEEGAMHITDSSGTQHRILFEYTREDDGCEQQQHSALVQRLLQQDRVHFLFGSTPAFAVAESQMAQEAQRLIYHCCVGPDSLYQMDMRYVFGIQSNSDRYSKKAMKSMALEGNVKRLYIFALEDNIFTSSTCQAAEDYAASVVSRLTPGFHVVQVKRYTFAEVTADGPGLYESIVQEAVTLGADAMLGCDFKDGGTTVARILGSRGHYLKALWLTVAPAHTDFMTALNEKASEHTLSAGQWHPALAYADPFHGTASEYSAAFQQAYGHLPSYVGAGASATSFSLAKAIKEAFEGCTFLRQDLDADSLLFNASAIECGGLSGGAAGTGYERVWDTLVKQTLDTFFGEIVFDRFRRNVAKDPITTQVQSGVIEAVLPLEFANKRIVMPHGQIASLAAEEDDDDIGSLKEGEFVAVVVVVVGSVLVACLGAVVFLLWRFKLQKNDEMDDHLIISPEELHVVNEPVQRWDGSWESGKAMYKNALVALEPLPNIKLQSFSEPNPSRYLTDMAIGPSSYTLDDSTLLDVEGSSAAGVPRTDTGITESPMNCSPKNSDFHEVLPPEVVMNGSVYESQMPPASLGNGSRHVHFHGPQDLSPTPPETPASGQDVVLNIDGLELSHRVSQPWSCASSVPQIPLSKSQVLKLLWRRKYLQHPGVVPVYGIVWSLPCLPCPNTLVLVRELQELGALSSVLENETMDFSSTAQKDIAVDLAQALAYLHAQENPRLKPALQPRLLGVLLNKHCRAKLMVPLACFLDALPSKKGAFASSRAVSFQGWSRQPTGSLSGVQVQDPCPPQANAHEEELEDVLRYGLGMACMLTADRRHVRPSNEVREREELVEGSFLSQLQRDFLAADHGEEMAALMAECCAITSNCRPCFTQILRRLETVNQSKRKSLSQHWQTNRIIQSSASNLVSITHASGTRATTADDLLYELFPNHVADALKAGCTPDPEPYPCVSIFFSDVCGYTNICSALSPQEVMDMLHRLYSRFDDLAAQLRLFKVETVGDAWMGVANLKHPQPDCHARLMAQFAFGCVAAANQELICPARPELGHIHIRVGAHCGPVMGAVVGTLNRRFGLFGDTVNVASRMESTSVKDHVQVSAPFYKLLLEQWPQGAKLAVDQGVRTIKGKGAMRTYILFPPDKEEESEQCRRLTLKVKAEESAPISPTRERRKSMQVGWLARQRNQKEAPQPYELALSSSQLRKLQI